MSWNGTNMARFSAPLCSVSADATSSDGHPWVSWKIRFGDPTSTAISAPSQSQGRRSSARGPTISSPSTTAPAIRITSSLL
jgi:hypothetical protein